MFWHRGHVDHFALHEPLGRVKSAAGLLAGGHGGHLLHALAGGTLCVGFDRRVALQIGERIRSLVEKTDFVWEEQHIPVTLSVGVAVTTGTERDSQALIQAADAALYEAKESGRNRVVASAAA